MTKRQVAFLACFLMSLSLQSQSLIWGGHVGGSFVDKGWDVTSDGTGAIYTIGEFSDFADFDPGIGTSIHIAERFSDIFLMKQDSAGNPLWVFTVGDTFDIDLGKRVEIDPSGNLVWTGFFTGEIDIDPGPGVQLLTSNYPGRNSFMAKFTPAGQLVWANRIGELGQFANINGMTIDRQGNIFTTGPFQYSVDFDPGPGSFVLTAPPQGDSYVAKYDSSGNFVWASQFRGTSNNGIVALDLTLDPFGNVLASGWFKGTSDFDPGPGSALFTSNGQEDCFVVKLNAVGQLVWARTIGNGSPNMTDAVGADAMGNVFFCGSFYGTVDCDPGTGISSITTAATGGGENAFLTKLDSNGNFLRADGFLSSGSSALLNIELDSAGGVIVSGHFEGNIDADPSIAVQTHTAVGFGDIFALRLDAAGQLDWFGQIGGPINDVHPSMEYDTKGRLYLTGEFGGTADLDMGAGTTMVTSNGNYDVFVAIAQVCTPSSTILTDAACGSYTLNASTYTSSGTYQQYFTNVGGCDSIVTLHLVIDSIDNSVTVAPNQVSAVQAGAQYQWLDCNNGFVPIPFANGQTYLPSATGTYAVQILSGSCIDTSACTLVQVVAVDEGLQKVLHVFPNPSSGHFHLTGHQGNADIRIFNALGQRVGKVEADQLDLSSQPDGIYLLEVRAEGAFAALRLMKRTL